MKLKLKTEDGWYHLPDLRSQLPEIGTRNNSKWISRYHWAVYVAKGLPIALTGQSHTDQLNHILTRHPLPTERQKDHLREQETEWNISFLDLMIEAKYIVKSLEGNEDDIYELDLGH